MYQALRPVVADFIARLRSARTADDFYSLHMDLLTKFAARQIVVSETLPRERSRAAEEIKRLSKMEPRPKEELKKMTDVLEWVEAQELVARAAQHALRVIADGIAWKALDYNRAAITVMGRGRRVGRLAIGPGFDMERDGILWLWNEHRFFAIHNDLTNCLRHGDLTVIDFGSPKRVSLAEVKVSELANAKPQLQRIDEAIGLINTGEFADAPTELPTMIVQVDGEYETLLAALPDLMTEARRTRFVSKQLHPAITVALMDYGAPGDRNAADAALVETNARLVAASVRRTFRATSTERRVRDRGETPPFTAPLSLYPGSPSDVADLILGFMELVVWLDTPRLEESFGAEGLNAVVALPPESLRVFLYASDARSRIKVPSMVRDAMLGELTAPASVIAAVRRMLDLSPLGEARVLVVFREEGRAWEWVR